MASTEALSYAFLEAHPADAARVLERLAATEAGALLKSVPVRLASPVLRQMLPFAGARCLEQLDDVEIAGLLRGTGAQSGVALIRYFGAERRALLLAQLPTTLTLAYELLLGYVELADLLRANPRSSLGRQVRPCRHRLPAQSPLNGLTDHQGWLSASTLPVVEHDDRFVGAFTHAALLRALSLERSTLTSDKSEDTLVSITSAYWLSVSALIQALVGMLPVKRHEGES